MRCSALPPCMSAFPMRRSRCPIRWCRRISSKLKAIIDILTPGLVFAADGRAFARAIAAAVPAAVEVVVAANPRPIGRRRLLRHLSSDAADAGGRCGARQSRSRHDRENPVHLRLDRPAQRRHQYPAHALRQPGDDPRRPGLRRRRAAGHGRLAAVEPHLRRQSRFRPRARQWRLALYRRGQADAGRHRGDRAQSARHRADDLFQRAERLRDAAAVSAKRTRRCAKTSSAG